MAKTLTVSSAAIDAAINEAFSASAIVAPSADDSAVNMALAQIAPQQETATWQYPALPSDAYRGGVPLSTVIVAVKRGAKSEASQAGRRYARYPATPFTLAEVLKVDGGPNTADFLYDIRHGFIVTQG